MKRIPLTGKIGKDNYLLVDDEDYVFMSKFNWFAVKNKLKNVIAIQSIVKPSHMLLGKPPKGLVWDHKNRNTMDCQKQNLRLATYTENGRNKSKIKNSNTCYKGVHFKQKYNKYYAQIKFCNENIYLGGYDSPIIAAQAYNIAAEILFEDFCNLNRVDFPKPELSLKVFYHLMKYNSKPQFNGSIVKQIHGANNKLINGQITPAWTKPLI